MAVETDLGCAKLESKPNGVQLTLTSSAQFAASGEDEVDLRRILTRHILKQNSDSRLWIHGASGFKLVVSLEIDVDQKEQLLDEAAETFADRLRSAKWWQQLHLSPSSLRTISISNHVREIEVWLRHEDYANDQSKRQLHKLDTGVPFHHVKPPPGIRQVALSEVRLMVSAQRQRSSKRRRTTKWMDSRVPSANSTMSSAALETERSSLNHASTETSELDVMQLGESEDAFLLQDCHDHDWLIESDDEEAFEGGDGMLFYDCVAPPLNMTDKLPLQLGSSKRPSDDVDLRADDGDTATDITSDTILELIDAAMRLAISGSPTSKSESPVTRRDKSVRPLARVVPPLWSPGHLPAVASRAPFLPTVCHAFSTVCSSKSKTEVMQTRRTVLLGKFGTGTSGRCCSDDTQSEIDAHHDTFLDDVAAHLWQMMQAHLYDPRAARHLRPLHSDFVQMDATELLLQLPLEDQDGTEYFDADETDEDSDDSSLLDNDSYYDDADFDDDFCDLAAETSLFESDQLHEPNDCCTSDKSHASGDEHDSTWQLSQIKVLETLNSSVRPANGDHEIMNSDDDFVEYSDDEVLSIGMASVSMNEVDGTGLSSLEQEDQAIGREEMLCN